MSESKEPTFDPFDKGSLYNTHKARWQLEQDFAEPTKDIFDAGTHLDRFSNDEKTEDYNYRTSMSVPLDMCQDAIRIRKDAILRTPPKREVEGKGQHAAIIQQLMDDADGDGTPLDDFMARVLYNYYSTGCDVATQMTSAPEDEKVKTEADVKRLGIRPFFLQFNPLQRYDWAVNGSRNFLWARYCLGEEAAEGEEAGSSGLTQFLTLTKDGWIHRKAKKDNESDTSVQITETKAGTHPLSKPPIIKVYFSESQKWGQGGVPISLISRPAMIARVALNLKSQADIDILASIAMWFFSGREKAPDKRGPLMCIASRDPESKMSVVQGDVRHIVEKREWLMVYIMEILRLLKFRGGMGSVDVSQGSGVRLNLEMTDLFNELRETAALMERTEVEMMRQAVSMKTGQEIPPQDAQEVLQYSVRYERDYILEGVERMLENIERWLTKCGFLAEQVPEVTKEMVRQLSNVLVREGSPAAEQIETEVKKADLSGTSEASAPEPVEAE